MGLSTDGNPITLFPRSWAQQLAAQKRPQYNVFPQTYDDAKRWKVERFHCDGRITAIGDYPTKQQAVKAARLLAGWRGDVNVVKRDLSHHEEEING